MILQCEKQLEIKIENKLLRLILIVDEYEPLKLIVKNKR